MKNSLWSKVCLYCVYYDEQCCETNDGTRVLCHVFVCVSCSTVRKEKPNTMIYPKLGNHGDVYHVTVSERHNTVGDIEM